VLLPIKINDAEIIREKIVQLNLDEDRKHGITSIQNIGMQIFSGINRDVNNYLVFISSLN